VSPFAAPNFKTRSELFQRFGYDQPALAKTAILAVGSLADQPTATFCGRAAKSGSGPFFGQPATSFQGNR
jgi:hypothetical protein